MNMEFGNRALGVQLKLRGEAGMRAFSLSCSRVTGLTRVYCKVGSILQSRGVGLYGKINTQ